MTKLLTCFLRYQNMRENQENFKARILQGDAPEGITRKQTELQLQFLSIICQLHQQMTQDKISFAELNSHYPEELDSHALYIEAQ